LLWLQVITATSDRQGGGVVRSSNRAPGPPDPEAPEPTGADAALGNLLASMPLAMVVIDPATVVQIWNPAAEALFGWCRDDVVGRPVPYLPEGGQPERDAWLATVLQGQTRMLECQRRHRDGFLLDVRLTAAPVRDCDGGVDRIVLTFEDVTERNRSRHVRAGVREVLELLAADTPLETLLVTLIRIVEGHSRNGMLGSILLMDPSGRHLRHGAAPSLPQPYNDAIDGIEIGPEVGACGKAAFTGLPAHSEDIAHDPHWGPFRELALRHGLAACWSTPILSRAGEVLGTFAMYYRQPRTPDAADTALVDVVTRTAMLAIERRRAELALQHRTTQFQSLLEQSPVGTYLVDSRLHFRQINPTALRYLGNVGSAEALVGRSFRDLVRALWPGRLAEEVIARFEHTLATGEPFTVPQFIDKRPSIGGTAYYHWQINRIVLPDGSHGVMCHFHDISEAVRSRQALALLNEQAERRRRFFDTILSHTPDLVCVFDREHRFTYANQALLATWGRTTDEAIGKTCLELGYEPWHAARHDSEIDQVVATRLPIRGEVPFHGTNGCRIYDYIFVPILGDDGEVEAIAGTTRDVTDRKRAEDALRESERLLGQVFDAAPAFMAALRGPDLVLEKVNSAYQVLVGAHRSIIGRPLTEALPELAASPFPAILRRVMETGEAFSGSDVSVPLVRSPDGTAEDRIVDFLYEPLRDPDGTISGVLVHGIDQTDRVRAEDVLRKGEQRIRFVMDSMPQKIFTADAGGQVDYFNPAWAEFAGLRPDTLLDWSGFVHPDDLADSMRAWEGAVASGEPFQCEQRFRRADGEYRWHLSRATAMKDEAGGVLLWIGSNTDIHEQRESANELRRLADELAFADRRKDEFIALLAHELRNPLAPISNALQIVRLSDGKRNSVQFATAVMERQLSQLVRLVDDLLDVSRISRGKIELRREPVLLSAAVGHAVEAARPLARAMDQALTVTLPAEPLSLSADPIRLAQIIGNLLTNASKFTPRGGCIRLHVEREGGEAVIRVSDTGIGIAADQLARIFEMFTQLDTSLQRAVGGLGIGLSLVRTLVEMHGGTVCVHSDGPGTGSEFTVRLPLLAAPTATATEARPAPAGC
jgi:PAS domain S-box-containing protein